MTSHHSNGVWLCRRTMRSEL